MYVREFHRHSSEVSRVDDLLIGNGFILNQLCEDVGESYQTFDEIVKGMDYIDGQQEELTQNLKVLEQAYTKEREDVAAGFGEDESVSKSARILTWADAANDKLNDLNRQLAKAVEDVKRQQREFDGFEAPASATSTVSDRYDES